MTPRARQKRRPTAGLGTEEERERIRRTFLAMALAHELKQPLNSLNLNVELLTKRLTRIPGAAADVAGPLQALGRVVDSVAACLESYYLRVQPEPVPRARVDVRPTLLAVVEQLQPSARRAGVKLRTTLAPNLPRLPAHAAQLGVAVENLLGNALVASASGDEVVLSAILDGEEIRISVLDHGPGMNPEVARRAVEIGFSTRGADGTGMTVAKFIAYHHAGGFQVETHPGAGTTVSIVLPLTGE